MDMKWLWILLLFVGGRVYADVTIIVSGAQTIDSTYCSGQLQYPSCGTDFSALGKCCGDGSTTLTFTGVNSSYAYKFTMVGTLPGGGGWNCTSPCYPASVDGMTYYVNASTCAWSTNATPPPDNYYMNGCVTNKTSFVVGYFAKYSDNYPTASSGPLAPNGVWCISRTNSTPFTYQLGRIVYNSDGGTNDFYITDPQSAWTNSIPPTGGTGSGTDGGPVQPGVHDASGGGSTNPVTGGQFAAGITNLINNIYNSGQLIAAGNASAAAGALHAAATSAGVTNLNKQPGMTNDYTGVLTAIRTNTEPIGGLSNQLAQVAYNTGTNQAWGFYTNTGGEGYAGASNTFWSGIVSGSNALYSAFASNNASISAMTQVSTSGVTGKWKITGFYGKTGKHVGEEVDLKPTSSKFWDLVAWLKVCITWAIAFTAMYTIRLMVIRALRTYYVVPGGNPGKGGWLNWLTWLKSLTMSTTLFAAVPVFMGAALQMVFTDTGSDMYSGPLSQSAINAVGGTQASWILEGIWFLNQFVPIYYALSVAAYLCVFMVTIETWLSVSCKLQRAFGN